MFCECRIASTNCKVAEFTLKIYKICLWSFSLVFLIFYHCSTLHGLAWGRHPMKTFSASLAICAGNSPVPGEFPAQRRVTRSFRVFFDLRPNKPWSKQSWRHRAHYDVTVMWEMWGKPSAGWIKIVNPTQSRLWLMVYWRRKDSGHHQWWYWPRDTVIFQFQHLKG